MVKNSRVYYAVVTAVICMIRQVLDRYLYTGIRIVLEIVSIIVYTCTDIVVFSFCFVLYITLNAKSLMKNQTCIILGVPF